MRLTAMNLYLIVLAQIGIRNSPPQLLGALRLLDIQGLGIAYID